MKIEININCFNFQKRLTWMLNSILYQIGELPEIEVSITYFKNNGTPNTESVIELFKNNGLNIKPVLLEEFEVRDRSIARNKSLANSTADWIIFADSDSIYHRTFFANLNKRLLTTEYDNINKVFGCNRISLNIDYCTKFIDNDIELYPRLINNTDEILSTFPVRNISNGGVAAGYFQLANMKYIRSRSLVYSKHFRNTRADIEFRRIVGGRQNICSTHNELPLIQYHLNHDRNYDIIKTR